MFGKVIQRFLEIIIVYFLNNICTRIIQQNINFKFKTYRMKKM